MDHLENVSKASSRVSTISAQNQLPNSNSHLGHRLRAMSTPVLESTEKMAPFPDDSSSSDTAWTGSQQPVAFFEYLLKQVHTVWQRVSGTKLVFLAYCILSCVHTAIALYGQFFGEQPGTTGIASDNFETNPLDVLPMDHLLTKITSIYPQPKALDPYVLKADMDPASITACLWATDRDIGAIAGWAARWTGPISLLVTTTVEPSSSEHEAILTKLTDLQNKNALLNTTLSAHLVHLDPKTQENPNAFLNLARLFSLTPRVALFPGNLSLAPPKTLYASLLQQSPASSTAILEPPVLKHAPLVLVSHGQTGFPFSPLAPVVLARDDPLWCTERFFPPVERAADWEECLWQVWLEHFGDIEVRQTKGWLHDGLTTANAASSYSSAVTKHRRRSTAKYRSETCVLATRQLAALRSADKAMDAKKARWLKRVCRSWMHGSNRD